MADWMPGRGELHAQARRRVSKSQLQSLRAIAAPMRDSIDISVILCTYNRCQSLAQALDSVARQILPPPANWEVIVVDNNSRDQTRQASESFPDRHPSRSHSIFAPPPDKSTA